MVKTLHIIFLLLSFFAASFSSKAESFTKKNVQSATVRSDQSIPEAKFRELFHRYLCRRLEKKGSDVVVSKFKVTDNGPVPAGKVTFQLFQKDTRRLAGYVRLIVLTKVNGVVKNKVNLCGWVDVFESVVCISRNTKKGETIKKGDIYLSRKNISHISPNIMTDISKVIGLMVKHNIKADSCLKEWMLKKSPIVDRGDMVTILAESDDLKVTVPGRVLMKGYLGELIKVQNLMSKKEIYAKVVNNSTVKVAF